MQVESGGGTQVSGGYRAGKELIGWKSLETGLGQRGSAGEEG